MQEIEFEVNGLRFKALSSGAEDAPIILALHGWLDNAASFNEIRQHFADYRFIALDLAGHGQTDHRPASMPYYLWDNISDVIEVMDQLSTQPMILMGHSMGASITSLLAATFPERVSHAVLIEGIAPLVYEESELPGLMADAIVKRRKMKQKSLRPYASIEVATEARLNGRWPVNPAGAKWLVERGTKVVDNGVIWSSDPNVMLPSLLRMSETQVQHYMSSIKVPVSLYFGESGLYEPDWQARMDLIPELATLKLEGNHHLHLYPEAAAMIAEDLKSKL